MYAYHLYKRFDIKYMCKAYTYILFDLYKEHPTRYEYFLVVSTYPLALTIVYTMKLM